MPLINDKYGYHFVAADGISANRFLVAGELWEIIETRATGKSQYDAVHTIRKVGTKETYDIGMRGLIYKLTGQTV